MGWDRGPTSKGDGKDGKEDDLEGHSQNAGFIKCNSTNICVTFSTVLTDTARRAVPRRQLSFFLLLISTKLCRRGRTVVVAVDVWDDPRRRRNHS